MKGSKGFESLQSLKTEMNNQRKTEEKYWHDEMQKRRNSLMERVGFVTPEEMINYIMRGGRITDREGQYFRLVDGMVEMIYEIYDEGAGPLGFGKKYETIDEFKDFVYNILAKHKEYTGDKWMPTWVKDKYYEF